MIALLDMTKEELKDYIVSLGEPAFRANQIYSWLYKDKGLHEMSNLPKKLIEKLSESCITGGVRIEKKYVSKDGTVKYLYKLYDGNIIEGVLMKYKYGYTLCVSSQVGCRMGCAFCASTVGGLVRDLTAGEILGQVIAANGDLDNASISHIVLMGSGEPLDNYNNIVKFLRLVHEPDGIGIGLRNISLSTCGLVDKIYTLADERMPLTLSVSLHAPNDELRRHLMPIAKKYSIGSIVKAAKYYFEATGRRVTYEYAMVDGVNDSLECAGELAALLKGTGAHVNIIPVNSVDESGLLASRPARIAEFYKYLEDKGVSVTIRREMGADISGACGQLRRGYVKEESGFEV